MPKRHKNHKGCSRCGHCRAWRVNRAFVRTTKAHGTEFLQYTTCNRCSRLYRKDGPLSKEDFREQYRGSDHTEYACPDNLIQMQDDLLTMISRIARTLRTMTAKRMATTTLSPRTTTTTIRAAAPRREAWATPLPWRRRGTDCKSLKTDHIFGR